MSGRTEEAIPKWRRSSDDDVGHSISRRRRISRVLTVFPLHPRIQRPPRPLWIESPTKLHLPAALEHYGVAFALVFAGVFGLFRFVVRPRRSETLGGATGLLVAGDRPADEEPADRDAVSGDEGEGA